MVIHQQKCFLNTFLHIQNQTIEMRRTNIQKCGKMDEAGDVKPTVRAKSRLMKKLSISSDKFVVCKATNLDTDYEILEKIGEGSFGSVYRILHKALKLERALKKIKKTSNEVFSTFQEIQVLKELDHRNILKIYEFYETQDAYLIVTDLFEGKELFDEIIDSDKISEEIAAAVIREVLMTLNYTHSKGIAHRDIKPENILVKNLTSSNIKLKIIDWGLGALVEGKKTNRVCGTPQYAAPEVFQGRYSVLCDMWSLGVMVFIMLTGNMPFKGKNTQQTIQKVKRTVINFRKTGFYDLSEEAQDFIAKLIKKDQTKRMSAPQALNHPWIKKFQKKQSEPVFLKETLERLKQFKITNQFGIAIVNLINNHFSSNQEKQKLEEIFSYLDANGDGVLSTQELIEGYTRLYGKALGEKIAEETFLKLDVNHNGSLQYSEFVALGLQRQKENEKQKLKQAFNLFDADKNGSISWQQIKFILTNKIDGVSEQQVREQMIDFNLNQSDEITFEQFYEFVQNIFNKVDEKRREENNLSMKGKNLLNTPKKSKTKNSLKTSSLMGDQKNQTLIRVTRSTQKARPKDECC